MLGHHSKGVTISFIKAAVPSLPSHSLVSDIHAHVHISIYTYTHVIYIGTHLYIKWLWKFYIYFKLIVCLHTEVELMHLIMLSIFRENAK